MTFHSSYAIIRHKCNYTTLYSSANAHQYFNDHRGYFLSELLIIFKTLPKCLFHLKRSSSTCFLLFIQIFRNLTSVPLLVMATGNWRSSFRLKVKAPRPVCLEESKVLMLTGDCEVKIQTNQQGVSTAQNGGPRK